MVHATGISAFLTLVKLVAFIGSGSLIVATSLLDSLIDSVVSGVNLWVSRLARSRPDRQHPFGHGGFEVLGSLIQGFCMAFFGFFLLGEAVRSLLGHQVELQVPDHLVFSAGVLFFSSIVGFMIKWILSRSIAKSVTNDERSLVLHADYSHYAGDAVSNFLGALGLLVIWRWNQPVIDIILGGAGGFYLIRLSYPILRKCVEDIVHTEADPKLQQRIVDLVFGVDSRILGLHQLRSRELGPNLFVDFHLKLSRDLRLEDAHEIGDAVMEKITECIPRADVIVHLDPDSEPDQENWRPSYRIGSQE